MSSSVPYPKAPLPKAPMSLSAKRAPNIGSVAAPTHSPSNEVSEEGACGAANATSDHPMMSAAPRESAPRSSSSPTSIGATPTGGMCFVCRGFLEVFVYLIIVKTPIRLCISNTILIESDFGPPNGIGAAVEYTTIQQYFDYDWHHAD